MLEISFIILSVAFLLLASAMAAILFRIWKVMERLLPIIEQLNQALPMILKNIQDTTINVKHASSLVCFQLDKLSALMNQLRGWSDIASIARSSMKLNIFSRGTNAAALTRGLSAFVRTFLTRDSKNK